MADELAVRATRAMTLYAQIGGTRTPLELADQPLGRGGEAAVYRVANLTGFVAKIYHRRDGTGRGNRAKLEAMIASPPQKLTVTVAGTALLQFAWPSHVVTDEEDRCAGFLMSEVPLERTVTFETFMSRDSMERALSADDRSLPRRVTICRNLAAALAELHRQHHYFVDIKPQNICLFKDTGVVCLVDTDSYSVAGPDGSRFPAAAYSAEYIAPELLRHDVPAREVRDDRQDCYALAVLIFRVLDHGLHPFQGIPAEETDSSEWNIDHCVAEGYYPHGREPHLASTRPHASTSDLWDAGTRALFDRAFGARQPAARPSAAEWRDHFDRLLQRPKPFVRCERAEDDVLHIHFPAAGCPACRLDALDARYASPEPPAEATVATATTMAANEPHAPGLQAGPPPAPTWSAQPPAPQEVLPAGGPGPGSGAGRKWPYAVVAALVAAVVLWPSRKPAVEPSVPPVQVVTTPSAPALPPPAPVQPTLPAPPAAPEPVAPADDASLAREMADSQDVQALEARMRQLLAAVTESHRVHQVELAEVLATARAGDDDATVTVAAQALRRIDWPQRYEGWQRFRKEARALNEAALALPESDVEQALGMEMAAASLDPLDVEVVGNLGTFLARHGKAEAANRIAVHALSLPRPDRGTGRSADWHLLAFTYALLGRSDESFAAYAVALAITPNLAGLCSTLLQQQARYGDALKAPIDALFLRIQERGKSGTPGCGYPPEWRR